jgi:hypothetical protein
VPLYVFLLRTNEISARLEGDALDASIARLGPLGKRRADRDTWVGQCEARNMPDARRLVEARLAQLSRYVPQLKLVDVTPQTDRP